jgi:hypothetical protein
MTFLTESNFNVFLQRPMNAGVDFAQAKGMTS